VALALQGKVDDAIAHYREASRLDPGSPEPRVNAGRALAGQGRTEEALVELQEAVRLQPGDADSHYDVAVLLARKGSLNEAAQHLETALRLDPGHRAARNAWEVLTGLQTGAKRGTGAKPGRR
jgi:Flp pilus assembly protein TadD